MSGWVQFARLSPWIVACAFAFLGCVTGLAQAQTKVALVIGNEQYQGRLDTLPNAAVDAKNIAAALKKAGFSKIDAGPALNLTRAAFVERVQEFDRLLAAAEPGAVGVLYYAGHGVARERRGDVYLLPVDSNLNSAADIAQAGFPLADLLQLLRTGKKGRTVIVIVDACRNVIQDEATPAPGSRGVVVGSGWGGEGSTVGLLERGVSRDVSERTKEGADYFVAFSTSADRVAYDTGLFSKILSSEINESREDVLGLFKRVGERMAVETPGAGALQLPTYEIGIYGAAPCLGPCRPSTDVDRFFDCAGCPWMHPVKAGGFLEGSPASEKGRSGDEPPARPSDIAKPFAIGVYEVTRAEWTACERAGACAALAKRNAWQSVKAPVEGVAAADAAAYLAWLSARSGKSYRLPTDQEWEYAARAGGASAFPFGDAIQPSEAAYDYSASYQGSKRAEYRGAAESVGSFPANAWGLYDMAGNVWERTCAARSPCGAMNLRGGSFKSAPEELRAANRFQIKDSDRREDVGLRVVRDY